MEMFLLGWVFSTEFLRACRGGNYIAFFRLARKATYLQACLMHAHFAKVISVAVVVNLSSALNVPSSWNSLLDHICSYLLAI